jgi:CRISPR/Cas system CSM-associated protein Csm3 (group 7 of RAMP superfamily)
MMGKFELKLSLETLSPFHVGTGEGFASLIDKQTLSYNEGKQRLPIIYGQSVKGVIREQFEDLQQLFDFPAEWVNHYFGTAEQMGRAYFSVFQLDEDIKKTLLSTTEDMGLFPVKSGNQISRRMKTAKKEHLFSIEHVEKSLLFEGRLSGYINAEEKGGLPDSLTFLLLAVLHTKKFGGKRRTGAGECRFYIEQLTWNGKTYGEEDVKQMINSQVDRISQGEYV